MIFISGCNTLKKVDFYIGEYHESILVEKNTIIRDEMIPLSYETCKIELYLDKDYTIKYDNSPIKKNTVFYTRVCKDEYQKYYEELGETRICIYPGDFDHNNYGLFWCKDYALDFCELFDLPNSLFFIKYNKNETTEFQGKEYIEVYTVEVASIVNPDIMKYDVFSFDAEFNLYYVISHLEIFPYMGRITMYKTNLQLSDSSINQFLVNMRYLYGLYY